MARALTVDQNLILVFAYERGDKCIWIVLKTPPALSLMGARPPLVDRALKAWAACYDVVLELEKLGYLELKHEARPGGSELGYAITQSVYGW